MTLLKTILTEEIEHSARFLADFDYRGLKAGRMDTAAAEAHLRASRDCLAVVVAALMQSMNADDIVCVTLYWRGGAQTMPLGQLQAWCLMIRMLASEYIYGPRIQQALRQANAWVDDLGSAAGLSQEQAAFAAETGRCLLQVLRDAQDAGVTSQMLLELNGEMVALPEVTRLAAHVAAADHVTKPQANRSQRIPSQPTARKSCKEGF